MRGQRHGRPFFTRLLRLKVFPVTLRRKENVMRRALLAVGAVLFAALSAVHGFAQNTAKVEQAIADLESKWAAAQKQGQADIVGRMLADRFITIGTDGKLATKDELLAHMQPGHWDDYG